MDLQSIVTELKTLNYRDVNRVKVDLLPVQGRPNRYSVLLQMELENGKNKPFLLGYLEKNYFQPEPSERLPSEFISYLEKEFENLWETAKSNYDSLDQRFEYIKNKINENLNF